MQARIIANRQVFDPVEFERVYWMRLIRMGSSHMPYKETTSHFLDQIPISSKFANAL